MKNKITLLEDAKTFLKEEISLSAKEKFAKVFLKVREGFNTAEDFKKLSGTADIYEFRVTDSGAWYRILAFKVHCKGDDCPTLVATHGLKKKKNKLPLSEIKKAETLKKKIIEQSLQKT
jgi:phage-related protein